MLLVTVSGAAAHTNANIGPVQEPFPQMDVWLREPLSSPQRRAETRQGFFTVQEPGGFPARP